MKTTEFTRGFLFKNIIFINNKTLMAYKMFKNETLFKNIVISKY